MTHTTWNHLGKGSAFLIGGEADCCYDHLIELAGGRNHAKILILTHASKLRDTGREIAQKLLRRGVPDEHIAWSGADKPVVVPSSFNCIFLSGGDQRRIMLMSKQDRDVIKSFLFAGGLLAGNSAGVPVFSKLMIAGGSSLVTDCSVNYGPGLDIIPGIFFDMHFMERLRELRIKTAISQFQTFQNKGIGIDEDTGLFIDSSGVATVYGCSGVHVYQTTDAFKTDLRPLSADRYLRINFRELLLDEERIPKAVPDPHRDQCDQSTFRSVSGIIADSLGADATVDLATWSINLPNRR